MKSTSHASYQRLNGNMLVGRPKQAKLAASPLESTQINNAIVALSKAKQALIEGDFIAQVSEAHRLTRQIARSRIV